MKNRGRFIAGVAMLAAVLPAAVATARVGPRLTSLRIDGYVGPPPEGRRERADLQLRVSGKDVRFQVTGATVLSGNMLAANIFNRVRPYRPNFILRGQQNVIGKVASAEKGERLRIMGQWRSGSRDLMVSSVESRGSTHHP
jgi:hypothetical protein